MNDDDLLGGVLGQLGQTVKQAAKQIVKVPEEMAKDLGGQVGGAKQNEEAQATSAKGSSEASEPQWKSDEERIKFLKDLYGSSQPLPEAQAGKREQAKKPDSQSKQTSVNPLTSAVENKKPSEFQEQIKDKSPEEQKELMELRNQLHREVYYDPTFNPKNPPAGGEERPAEKVENEKKQEMQDLQKKENKKPQPLAVTREQNKAEQFRGASG